MQIDRNISVGILEDNAPFRGALSKLVQAAEGFELSFVASTVAESRAAYAAGAPDLLLVDLQLPDGSGLELVRDTASEQTRVLILTILADRDSLITALEEGAHGYLLKDTLPDRIVEAMRGVLAGDTPISPSSATHLLAILRRPPADQSIPQPTPREREIVEMISRGLTYSEIAHALGISVHTVGDHIKAIYRKLEVGSRSEAVFEARHQGWVR